MIDITLQHGYHVVTLFAVLTVAWLLVALAYRRAWKHIPRRQARILLGLRVIAVLLVVLLLFRPLLRVQRWTHQRKTVVFLVDASSSMSVVDDASNTSRYDQARRHLIRWWGTLRDDFDLRLVEFSDTATAVESPEALSRKPEGRATSLTVAIDSATRQAERARIEAVVLVSDGVHNSAGAPHETAAKAGTTIFTVGTGSSLHNSATFRDIRVSQFECPEQLTKSNRVRITAGIDAAGLAGHVVDVVLEEDGKPVASQSVTLDGAAGPQTVALEFVPQEKGVHTYTVRVPVAKGEKIAQNNRRQATSLVVDARIRVLYVEGTLRPEYGAITGMFLAKDPNIEYCALVQTRPNVFTQRSNIEGMSLSGIPSDRETFRKFDVFLMGDLDRSYLSDRQLEQIRQRVSEGAGLLMMGGYHSLGPGGYGGSAMEDLLPVMVGNREIGQVTDRFVPRLTDEGLRHPIFANITRFFPSGTEKEAEQTLPPLRGCVRVRGPKPGASVLAVCSLEKDDRGNDMPVLAVQSFGKGRTAVFTGDTTRVWHQALRALDQDSPFLRFWGQTVRWLAGRAAPVDTAASLTVHTDKTYYEPGTPVVLSALVRNDKGEGSNQANVSARIPLSKVRSKRVSLALVPGPAGHYQYSFDTLPAGRYEIRVFAELEQKRLEAEPVTIEVGRPNLEFDRVDLDEKTLAAIATASGGRYSHIATADRLMDGLRRRQRKRLVTLELPLFSPSLFWLLFVAVVTAEWVLRRRYQLR